MNELQLQDKYVINFLANTQSAKGLQYNERKANTVSPDFFIIDDLKTFLSETSPNNGSYRKVKKKLGGDEDKLMQEFVELLSNRIKSAMNIAIVLNKGITFHGEEFQLFYPSGSTLEEDKDFEQNIFSVVQELPYSYKFEDKRMFAFRPDICFFVNGIYIGYSELKSAYNNQNAHKKGRNKVANDYQKAVQQYLQIAGKNDVKQTLRKNMLWIFEKAIHITTTDINDTYIVRNISTFFEDIKAAVKANDFLGEKYKERLKKEAFKSVPLLNRKITKTKKFEEVFQALYSKRNIEKEIRYYNFIERELVKKEGSKNKEYKHNDGRLIAPRPKQKFGADKIINKIDEFITHENDPDYLFNKFKQELKASNVSEPLASELIEQRRKYRNNKHVYSLLLQYAAGFGKSNIIGWTALQLKDLRRKGAFIYDKIMIVVDRVQLRDQLDSKMHNMNINKKMFIEANNQASFKKALQGDTRIVVVNLQKFNTIKQLIKDDQETIDRLADMRVAFIIDEVHRSHSNVQHDEMLSLFDEVQSAFDNSEAYTAKQTKKNLIIGFTATPSDHTLARFGEFSKYAEGEKMWIPFDSYTMKEAIDDKYILNPIKGLVPVSAKMYFEVPDSDLEGFEEDTGYEEIPDDTDTGVDANGNKYRISKKRIYENDDRIKAISKFVVERLLNTVYPTIRGAAKAMLAVSSIPAAIKYVSYIKEEYQIQSLPKKYDRFKDAPIYIVYSSSDNQMYPSAKSLNGGKSEEKVLQDFKLKRNGLVIVVDKLQTGYDEPRLQTLFLDKEIKGINAIQTISRVNRKTKYKHDCKIVDLSYKNVNIKNIQAAFEKFSNVVVSDFNPLGEEKMLHDYYEELCEQTIFENHFRPFCEYLREEREQDVIMAFDDDVTAFIEQHSKEAKLLRKKVNKYFYILNRIESVIDLDKKYNFSDFIEFWRRFNMIYNNTQKTGELIDDVEIYFDNRIGIIAPKEYETPKVSSSVKDVQEGYEGKQYKFDILKVIEKRNQEEDKVEELIQEFESKIQQLFDFIKQDDLGKRVIAKIQDDGSAFDDEEINEDFGRVYRKFIRRNKKTLGDFFIKETKGLLNQLCNDFRLSLVKNKIRNYSVKNDTDWWAIIEQGETNKIEFKATLEQPVLSRKQKIDLRNIEENIAKAEERNNIKMRNAQMTKKKEVESSLNDKAHRKIVNHSAMKTLAAFANSEGGTLFIGIDEEVDGRPILGTLSSDFTLFKNNKDSYLLHLDQLVAKYFSDSFQVYLSIEFIEVQNEEVLKIDVKPSSKEIFLKKDGQEIFYIRRQASSKDLTGKAMLDYIRERF